MLKVDGLDVSYGSTTALRGLCLHVAPGEIVSLIGPNGAGKSTLLRTMSGLKRPTAGTAVFDGTNVIGHMPEDIARLGLTLVPEGRHIFQTLSVLENLQVPICHRSGAAVKTVDWILTLFPILGDRLKMRAGNLSGGEQQQLAIARALVMQPRMVMVDEPSLGLAPLVIQTVYDCFRKLRQEGVTLLIVEQSAARVGSFADRVYVMNHGAVVLEGSPEIVGQGEKLAKAYFSRPEGADAELTVPFQQRLKK